jgi:hypothetical protein
LRYKADVQSLQQTYRISGISESIICLKKICNLECEKGLGLSTPKYVINMQQKLWPPIVLLKGQNKKPNFVNSVSRACSSNGLIATCNKSCHVKKPCCYMPKHKCTNKDEDAPDALHLSHGKDVDTEINADKNKSDKSAL